MSQLYTGSIIGRLEGHDEFIHLETFAQPRGALHLYAAMAQLFKAHPQIAELQLNMGRAVPVEENV